MAVSSVGDDAMKTRAGGLSVDYPLIKGVEWSEWVKSGPDGVDSLTWNQAVTSAWETDTGFGADGSCARGGVVWARDVRIECDGSATLLCI